MKFTARWKLFVFLLIFIPAVFCGFFFTPSNTDLIALSISWALHILLFPLLFTTESLNDYHSLSVQGPWIVWIFLLLIYFKLVHMLATAIEKRLDSGRNRKILAVSMVLMVVISAYNMFFATYFCHDTVMGWMCWIKAEQAVSTYGEKCLGEGGYWEEPYTFLMQIGPYNCLRRLDDAGKACNDSSQCIDKCEVDYRYFLNHYNRKTNDYIYYHDGGSDYLCKNDQCGGSCSPYPVGEHCNLIEVIGNKVRWHSMCP
ncbi:MAG: hypothetical protein V1875_08850 [Candidatus Altiarchaeota archaeon]